MADDALNLPESQSSDQTDDQKLPEVEELESTGARVSELESLIAEKDKELGLAQAHITELEQVVVDKESAISNLEQATTESKERLATVNDSLAQAVVNYKALVITSNPTVPAALVTGDTIESINDSLEKAKTMVDKVRQELETEIASTKVPAGAPQRVPVDLSALSPREKIQYAIGGKR